MDNIGLTWKTSHGKFEITKENIPWIMANVKTSMFNNEDLIFTTKLFMKLILILNIKPDTSPS